MHCIFDAIQMIKLAIAAFIESSKCMFLRNSNNILLAYLKKINVCRRSKLEKKTFGCQTGLEGKTKKTLNYHWMR